MATRGVTPASLATGAVVLILSGCGTSGCGTVSSSSAAAANRAEVPTGFDPCMDIPQSILDPEGLQGKQVNDFQADAGKTLWHGCVWSDPDGYGATIQTTNLTIDAVRDKHFPGTHEYTIAGRKAIATDQSEQDPSEACTINAEPRGGSLEFNLDNPASAPKTGRTNTCQLARELAEKVVSIVPATV
ncbi:DUF3558 domain-containing protein [Nocardia jiangxiensis]|uniref:DUF3558 domain-containing protein n=1 Tax=Nocardia jiangxiensis TaxID=282685 RepID=A0ABW6S8A2_9NOCA